MTGVAVKLMSCVVVWSAVFAGSSPNNTTNLSLTTDDVYLARTDDDHAANDYERRGYTPLIYEETTGSKYVPHSYSTYSQNASF